MSGENEGYSSESFLEDEPTSSKRDVNDDENAEDVVVYTPPFEVEEEGNKESFVSAVENFLEVSSPVLPGDIDEDAGVGVTCMSTIEEESKSCYESSTAPSISRSHRPLVEDRQEHLASSQAVDKNKYTTELDLNISAELREFKELVHETEAGLNEKGDANASSSSVNKSSSLAAPAQNTSKNLDCGNYPANVEELLRKLEQIQNTQDILEQVINTDVTIDAEELNVLISQIPLMGNPVGTVVNSATIDVDQSERSVSAEIASIQKIIDAGNGIEMIDTSNSLNSEVAGGNNLLSMNEDIGPTSPQKGRGVDDVLREYEELERSLSRASALDESYRSDISSLPPLSTYSNRQEVTLNLPPPSVPVIKPPVLKSVVQPPSTSSAPPVNPEPTNFEMSAHYHSSYVDRTNKEISSSQKRPVAPSSGKVAVKPKSSRADGSQSMHSIKPQVTSHSARPTTSVSSARNNTQDAYKPRNRRMPSPRITSTTSPRRQSVDSDSSNHYITTDAQKSMPAMTAAGENYNHPHHTHYQAKNTVVPNSEQQRHITEKTDYAVAEALKTIQKLSTMVERQETLLEAYSKDNEKLWTQLKDSKTESQEKESNFQDVINSLRTEVATLKLNRLVKSSTSASAKVNSDTQTQGALSPPGHNKAELERMREDAELKSQQLMELRKEVLLLQTKLTEKQSKAPVLRPSTGGGVSALVFHEKEKEYNKEINVLKKQVRTLQKILYSKDSTAPPTQQQAAVGGNRSAMKPLQRTKSDVIKQNSNANLIKSIRNSGVDTNAVFPKRPGSSPIKGVNINTSDIIQASLNCMDQERHEFESIIEDKNKLIFEKERTILNLKEQVETLKRQIPVGEVVEPGLVDELRSRIITQNKAIQTLKEHLSTYKKLEAENLLLKEDKCLLQQQVQELRRKLDFAQHLVKPENEVLCLLSEKVDELNSRYHHRERQLDTLLSKLTLKTTTAGGCGIITSSSNSSSSSGGGRPITTNLSPRRIPLDQFTNNNGSLGGPLLTIGKARSSSAIISADILHMADFSPSNSFQLYNSDLPDM